MKIWTHFINHKRFFTHLKLYNILSDFYNVKILQYIEFIFIKPLCIQQLMQNLIKIKNGNYYGKFVQKDCGRNKQYVYKFYSVCKFDTKLIEIYHHYFPNCMKKIQRQPQSKHKNEFSEFFIIFMKIFFLRSLIIPQKKLWQKCISFTQMKKQFFGNDYRCPKCKIQLLQYLQLQKTCTEYIKSKQFEPFFQLSQKGCDLYSARKVINKIYDLINDFLEKLNDEEQLKILIQTEEFPQQILQSNQQIKIYIMANLTAIRDFIFLSSSLKQQARINFLKRNEKQYNFKSEQIKQTYFNKKSQDKQQNNQQQKVKSQIRFSKYLSEDDFVYTPMFSYLSGLTNIQEKQRQKLMESIIKNIVRQSLNYNQKTKFFYPSISLQDIYFDQKKLQAFISEQKMILYEIGYREGIDSVQMKLVKGTPRVIESQKCYLQYCLSAQILLNRVCYFPSKSVKEEKVKQFKINKNQNKNYEEQQEKQIAQRYEYNAKQLDQNVHVWRLICILYYILKLQKLSTHLYRAYDEERGLQVNYSKPIQNYRRIKKKYYEMMKSGEISVPRLLSFGQKLNPDFLKNQDIRWDFNMQSLKNLYNLKVRKQLLQPQPISLTRIKSEFYIRGSIVRSIDTLFAHDCFKKVQKVLNAKKQFMIFFINMIEYFYQIKRVISQSNKKKHSRSQIIESFKQYYKDKIIDIQLFGQAAIKKCAKFQQYKNRDQGDLNRVTYYQFNRLINQKMYKDATDLKKIVVRVQSLQKQLQKLENFISKHKNTQDENQKKQLQKNLRQVQKIIQKLVNICDQKYKQSTEFISKILQSFQKGISIQNSSKYDSMMVRKLILSIRILLILNEDNWKHFQLYYQDKIIDNKNAHNNKNRYRIQDLQQQQLQKLNQNLSSVQKFILKQELLKLSRKQTNNKAKINDY